MEIFKSFIAEAKNEILIKKYNDGFIIMRGNMVFNPIDQNWVKYDNSVHSDVIFSSITVAKKQLKKLS